MIKAPGPGESITFSPERNVTDCTSWPVKWIVGGELQGMSRLKLEPARTNPNGDTNKPVGLSAPGHAHTSIRCQEA